LQTALQWFSVPAVIVNGQVVSRRGTPPTPDELCHLVARLIDRARTAPPPTPTYSARPNWRAGAKG
jgi:hypothetical protein